MWSSAGPGRSRGASEASSVSASGLPPVAACSQSAVSAAIARPALAASSSRAAPAARPSSASSVEPGAVDRGVHARAHREDHDDRVGQQPPGGEQQGGGRRPVEPLGVVDDHDDGPLLGDRAEQTERGGADQVALRGRVVGEPERRAQRGGLRAREPVDGVEHGPQELVQPGPRELELGVDPPGAEHERAAGDRRRVLEQRRLADPGLAPEHQHAAGSPLPAREELFDPRPLCLASDEHACTRADQE